MYSISRMLLLEVYSVHDDLWWNILGSTHLFQRVARMLHSKRLAMDWVDENRGARCWTVVQF